LERQLSPRGANFVKGLENAVMSDHAQAYDHTEVMHPPAVHINSRATTPAVSADVLAARLSARDPRSASFTMQRDGHLTPRGTGPQSPAGEGSTTLPPVIGCKVGPLVAHTSRPSSRPNSRCSNRAGASGGLLVAQATQELGITPSATPRNSQRTSKQTMSSLIFKAEDLEQPNPLELMHHSENGHTPRMIRKLGRYLTDHNLNLAMDASTTRSTQDGRSSMRHSDLEDVGEHNLQLGVG